MAANDDKIRMTVVVENKLYHDFHLKCELGGRTKNGVIRRLIEQWLAGKVSLESSSKSSNA